jgi:hypothetical protein
MQNDSALKTRIHNLSDEELLKMIKAASEYRPEANSYAQEELLRRGGIDAVNARIQELRRSGQTEGKQLSNTTDAGLPPPIIGSAPQPKRRSKTSLKWVSYVFLGIFFIWLTNWFVQVLTGHWSLAQALDFTSWAPIQVMGVLSLFVYAFIREVNKHT